MLEIVRNDDLKIITVGSSVFTRPDITHRRESNVSLKDTILKDNGLEVPQWSGDLNPVQKFLIAQDASMEVVLEPIVQKDIDKIRNNNVVRMNKEYAKLLGKKFNLRFYANMHEMWVKNHFQDKTSLFLREKGRQWKSYCTTKVERAHANINEIHRLEDAGQHNLIPLVLMFNERTDIIRENVGEEEWSMMASASCHRNRLFLDFFYMRMSASGSKEYADTSRPFGSIWHLRTGNLIHGANRNCHKDGSVVGYRLGKSEKRLHDQRVAALWSCWLWESRGVQIQKIKDFAELEATFEEHKTIVNVLDRLSGGRSSWT